MDREYISKHGLMEAHKQFMKLVNEGYISTSLTEAGEDEAPQPEVGQEPSMGGDPNTQPPMDGGAQPMDNGQTGMQPADGQPPMGDGQQPPMGDPNGAPDMGADMSPMNGGMPPEGPMDSEPEEKDKVIDVDDLTKAQEKLNNKQNMVGKDLGQLDNRIEKLMTAVEKMKSIIDHNNNEITDLKAELQKRVPTQTERLDMRSLDTYPFNVKPTDYWKNKESQGGYEARYDNNEPEGKQELTITNKDIDNYSDRDIEKSFDDELNQTMDKIFKGFV